MNDKLMCHYCGKEVSVRGHMRSTGDKVSAVSTSCPWCGACGPIIMYGPRGGHIESISAYLPNQKSPMKVRHISQEDAVALVKELHNAKDSNNRM